MGAPTVPAPTAKCRGIPVGPGARRRDRYPALLRPPQLPKLMEARLPSSSPPPRPRPWNPPPPLRRRPLDQPVDEVLLEISTYHAYAQKRLFRLAVGTCQDVLGGAKAYGC